MKKYAVILLILIGPTVSHAQWNTNGSNIYYNAGNTGIGTTTPGAKVSFNNVDDGTNQSSGITWYNPSPMDYGIYRTAGTWSSPNYQQLKLHFETGIILNPGSAYGKSYVDIQGGGLRVSSGNVGIGTTTPQNKMQIGPNPQGWSGNDLVISNASSIALAISNAGDHTMFYGSGDIAVRPGFGKWAVYASQTGNVGIGHSSPQKSLDVKTGVNDFASIGESLAVGQWSGLHFGYKENNALYRKSAIVFERVDNHANGKIHILNNNNNGSQSATLADARLTIDQNGNAGIGTVSPYSHSRLHVKSPSVSPWGFMIEANNNSDVVGVGHDGNYGYISTSYLSTGAHSPLHLRTSNITRVAINVDGKVGIGTTTPDEALTVNGTIHSTRVKVDVTVPGPDYVFESDYNLLSLSEIKKYIDANKHLPEIPSAKEMEKNGIDVAEMNMLLLKKVEELTLHLIEQQKQIEELKRAVNTMSAESNK